MLTAEDDRQPYGEPRYQSFGWWRERVIFLVWTPRGDDGIHLISCRYADRHETHQFFKTAG
jgi:uncharacterized protein